MNAVDSIFLSVIIPAYNEQIKIQEDVSLVYEFLNKQTFTFEVLVVDDGSQDNTFKIVTSLKPKYKNLRCIHYTPNRGKGHAVKTGMLEARGEYMLFADAGTCVPYEETLKGLKLLQEGYDIAIGSRALPDSKIISLQPKYRQFGSKAFALIARFLMGVHTIKDLQCGFKFFKQKAPQFSPRGLEPYSKVNYLTVGHSIRK